MTGVMYLLWTFGIQYAEGMLALFPIVPHHKSNPPILLVILVVLFFNAIDVHDIMLPSSFRWLPFLGISLLTARVVLLISVLDLRLLSTSTTACLRFGWRSDG